MVPGYFGPLPFRPITISAHDHLGSLILFNILLVSTTIKYEVQYHSRALYKNPLFSVDKNEAQVLMFIYWDCKILSGTATFHKRGVLDCNFQNPSEIPE